tara:strand:+ start:443 stop:604 length:162 start_codon:yes stop_codon:yes gene_type:complete
MTKNISRSAANKMFDDYMSKNKLDVGIYKNKLKIKPIKSLFMQGLKGKGFSIK